MLPLPTGYSVNCGPEFSVSCASSQSSRTKLLGYRWPRQDLANQVAISQWNLRGSETDAELIYLAEARWFVRQRRGGAQPRAPSQLIPTIFVQRKMQSTQ